MVGFDKNHVYRGRAGVFDVAMGHMNNAAFLSHAELARWEMTAENGLLEHMFRQKAAYVVTGNAIRYRREIKPLLRRFEIDTRVTRLTDRDIWMSHNFRHAGTEDDQDRLVRAQVVVKAVVIGGGSVLDPRVFMADACNLDPTVIEKLSLPTEDTVENDIQAFIDLEEVQRLSAAEDDKLQQ